MEHKIMTMDEKFAMFQKIWALEDAGQKEEAQKFRMQIPIAPYLAKWCKEKVGVDFLLKSGLNLAEADEEYGKAWLTH
ncbi:hypothetical protein SAMD00024442_28_32 [Candidatus Symbiothrix dinenymphae]|nr:hypothetical protein SAMD00024442_28_32 [Candidatus Symbiothrix dinenymphae]